MGSGRACLSDFPAAMKAVAFSASTAQRAASSRNFHLGALAALRLASKANSIQLDLTGPYRGVHAGRPDFAAVEACGCREFQLPVTMRGGCGAVRTARLSTRGSKRRIL
jgi:hypothetical protein